MNLIHQDLTHYADPCQELFYEHSHTSGAATEFAEDIFHNQWLNSAAVPEFNPKNGLEETGGMVGESMNLE